MMPRRGFILMVDDDRDDFKLVQAALAESGRKVELRLVEDGMELLDYLLRRGHFAAAASAPCPDLILLDLNMPRKNGRSTLNEIKTHPDFRRIPVVVLTTSREPDDVRFCYEAGASSYIVKPMDFDGWVEIMATLSDYWFEHVHLPHGGKAD